MIFLVQAIKKLFVTCQAAYDVIGGLAENHSVTPHRESAQTQSGLQHRKRRSSKMGHGKQVKLEGYIKKKRIVGKMK